MTIADYIPTEQERSRIAQQDHALEKAKTEAWKDATISKAFRKASRDDRQTAHVVVNETDLRIRIGYAGATPEEIEKNKDYRAFKDHLKAEGLQVDNLRTGITQLLECSASYAYLKIVPAPAP
jgi:hypothetical protein